jgi:hypothetical protein
MIMRIRPIASGVNHTRRGGSRGQERGQDAELAADVRKRRFDRVLGENAAAATSRFVRPSVTSLAIRFWASIEPPREGERRQCARVRSG